MKRLAVALVVVFGACSAPVEQAQVLAPAQRIERVPEAADPTAADWAALAAIPTTTTTAVPPRISAPRAARRRYSGPTPPASVKRCESGGNYAAQNKRSSASGAWQIIDGTWANYKGYPTAASAPPHIQDERAAQLWAGGRGASHWKACL